ncbi:MAG: hypothetical protein Kow0059_09550 [Candidatus Sumerlaeia bacterium]
MPENEPFYILSFEVPPASPEGRAGKSYQAPPPEQATEAGAALDEEISRAAWNAGCLGLEEPAGQQPGWRIYFSREDQAHTCAEVLRKLFQRMIQSDVQPKITSEYPQNWMSGWRDQFHPIEVGGSFLIAPPWAPVQGRRESPSRRIIFIEPGMAFGTGTHATTQMCLELAESHLRPGVRVLDVGTGSGILILAAAIAGAHLAVGVDCDPEIADNFFLNLRLNHCHVANSASRSARRHSTRTARRRNGRAEVFSSTSRSPTPIYLILSDGLSALGSLNFDLIFANLLAPQIEAMLDQMLAPRFAAQAHQPVIIGSGLLREEWPALRKRWKERYRLAVSREQGCDEWIAFEGRIGA